MANKRSSAHKRAQRDGKVRDNNTCQICGSRSHVEGHHVVDYQYGGAADKENIISLCRNHHKSVHKGLIDLLKI